MAVHHRRRRYHRISPRRSRSRPPQRSLHVRQKKVSHRIRIRLPFPVSSQTLSFSNMKTNTYQILKQPHNLLHPPHLHSSLRPRLKRRHPRRRRTHPVAPSRGPLRPHRLQRLLSPAVHGSREYKLWHSRRRESGT